MVLSLTAIPASAKAAPKLNKTSALMTVDDSITLKVKNTTGKVTWKTSNAKVAGVTKGKVIAKKKGTSVISAKVAKKTLKCKIYVVDKSEEFDPDTGEKIVIDKPSPTWVTGLPEAKTAMQMVVIAAENESDRGAWFTFHEKQADGTWRIRLTTPCFIGKNGLGKTKEGDAKTPTGSFTFNSAFGNADDPGCKIPYVKATEYTYWSDNPNYMYNQLIEDCRQHPDLDVSKCEEHISEYPVHYQYCLNVSYNEEGNPGAGSGIFLHCLGTGKPWTGGCIAIPIKHMKWLMTRVDENTIVVINTLEKLGGNPDTDWPTLDLSA